jgi:hypothetical protein
MANDNIKAGKKSSARRADRPKIRVSATKPLKRAQLGVCGAMSQQSCDSGNQSAPQKFVQLVGYRDPRTRSEPVKR